MHQSKLAKVQRRLHLLRPFRIIRPHHQHPEAVPLALNAHAFRVVQEQVDAEVGRVLGAAGAGFAVVPLLVHHARQPDAVEPKEPPDAPGAAIGRGIDPNFPAALLAMVGQGFSAETEAFVAQQPGQDAVLGRFEREIIAATNEGVIKVEGDAHSFS